jgi:hypothetical protein
MKKLFGIMVLSLLLSGNAFANPQVLDCRQVVEIDDDVGEDIIIKHIVQINIDSKSIKVTYPGGSEDFFEIKSVTEDSIEATRKTKNGTEVISIHRYTLEFKYVFYNKDAVYENESSPFECSKLEKKI